LQTAAQTVPGTALDFEQLVKQHQDMVFRMLVRLTGTRDGVDDLAQDVFLRLFRGLQHFRGDAQLCTYLHRIVINVAHDARRRHSTEARRTLSLAEPLTPSDTSDGSPDGRTWQDRLPHPGPNAEQSLQQDEFAAAVEQALAHLTPQERAALVLYHQEELTYEQIALAMLIPVNTVRTHLHRGRARLRTLLSKSREGMRL
jgi:RNA polymerase sigma-70 factor (ECF subfamily)